MTTIKEYSFIVGAKIVRVVANTIIEAKIAISKKYPEEKATCLCINIKYNSYEKRISRNHRKDD